MARKTASADLAATAHFSQADDAVIGLDFDNCAYEAAPVTAIGVAERGFEGDGNSCGADVPDLHLV